MLLREARHVAVVREDPASVLERMTVEHRVRALRGLAHVREHRLARHDAADAMKERKGRRILLLICGARDRGSRAKLEEAIEAVEREGVEVFAATYWTHPQARAGAPG